MTGCTPSTTWTPTRTDLEELLDPSNWPNRQYAVLGDESDLIGFFGFKAKDRALEVGLGLRPDLTGHGLGFGFLSAGLEFARERYGVETFCLYVATFNQRAIRVYERAGFIHGTTSPRETNGGVFDFLYMNRPTR
ncbi:MAG: GNAT family N-acetyltransferase [Chloroflexi bacterium]|nr:GNAT family N-acetyltransferase [Chloroflexota bacterium]